MSEQSVSSSQLVALLDAAATDHPNRPALDFMGRRWSYHEIDAQAKGVAASLVKLGVAPGDRVALCLPNTPYFVIAYFAVLRIGAIVVSVNPLYTQREIEHLLSDSGARHIFVADAAQIFEKVAAAAGLDSVILCPLAEILPRLKSLAYRLLKRREIARLDRSDRRLIRFANLASLRGRECLSFTAPEDIAVLQYTGGTTGRPKGAMLTHASLDANCRQMAEHDRGRPETAETVIGVLPMFHVFALTTVLNYSIRTAACIVLLPRFEMKSFLSAMRRTRPARLFVVPTILTALNALPEDKLSCMRRLRLCVSGGAPLPCEVRALFESRTGTRVLEGYGLSESSPIVSCNPTDGEARDGSAGIAFPGTIIEIRSLDTDELRSDGESGEVCVRGPQLMRGYWNRPDETREVLADGLLRTGDVGYLDKDGYLFLIDRIKDLILCGGYNVYPRVIEDALYEHSDVVEATVIGVPDEYRGEAPKAFVKLRDGAATSVDELLAFLRERISKIEMPREIELRDELPKTLIGKLSKKELRETGVPARQVEEEL